LRIVKSENAFNANSFEIFSRIANEISARIAGEIVFFSGMWKMHSAEQRKRQGNGERPFMVAPAHITRCCKGLTAPSFVRGLVTAK